MLFVQSLASVTHTLLLLPIILSSISLVGAASPYDDLEKPVLEVHNTQRAKFDAQPLEWNKTLAESASKYAEECEFEHSETPNVGENLAAGYPDPTNATTAWAEEESKYKTGKISSASGHFTQMVWKNTTSVGCGWKECDDLLEEGMKQVLMVCHYSPPGNVDDEQVVKENVMESGVGDGRVGTVRRVWRSVWGLGAVVVVWCWLN